MEQELLEVADLGLHCLAWQSNGKPGYEGEDSRDSAKAVDNRDTKGISKSLRSNAVMNGSPEVGDDQTKVQQEHVFEVDAQRLQPEDGEKSTHRLFQFQPLVAKERDEASGKLFIVQPLEGKEKDQDRVIDLMKNRDLNHVNNSDEDSWNGTDCEERKDVYRDIEIEDLEAEKENVGENMCEVENFLKDNSSSMSKNQLRGGHKKLQDATKVDSYEEIII